MMHPLDMPETLALAARVSFDIARVDYAAPEASGRQGGVQAGWPLWMARWELDRVDPVLGDLWRGFHARLRGRQRLFFGWDTTRPFPLAHRRGFDGMRRPDNTAFNGAATGWAQNVDGDGNAQIALTGFPAGLRLSIGDYVGLRWDAAGAAAGTHGRRALVRVVVPAVASPEVIAMADAWVVAGAAIEAARLGAKSEVAAATTLKGIVDGYARALALDAIR